MQRQRIVFDVDGVLADFTWGFTELRQRLYGEGYIITSSEAQSWDEHSAGHSDYNRRTWDHIIQSDTFWAGLPKAITESTVDHIIELESVHDLYFATSRIGTRVKEQTEDWLMNNLLLFTPTVILTKYKGEFCKCIGATMAIDDKADNASAIAWLTEGKTQSYLLDRPYNRYDETKIGSSKVKRIYTVDDFIRGLV